MSAGAGGRDPTGDPTAEPTKGAAVKGAAELVREAEHRADRLAVVAPRLSARGTPEAMVTLAGVRVLLQELADLGADAQGRARRPVPELAPHALADQLLVLVHDLVSGGESRNSAHAGTLDAGREVLTRLRLLI